MEHVAAEKICTCCKATKPTSLVPSVSIEGLLAARDVMQEAVA